MAAKFPGAMWGSVPSAERRIARDVWNGKTVHAGWGVVMRASWYAFVISSKKAFFGEGKELPD
ncbi:hypothetical protein SAMN05444166_4779 [Singulisphaera sp. GP187]|nr:hypothetical protein SAMN05444166_4779 [Singulisphaera sp. GP187]